MPSHAATFFVSWAREPAEAPTPSNADAVRTQVSAFNTNPDGSVSGMLGSSPGFRQSTCGRFGARTLEVFPYIKHVFLFITDGAAAEFVAIASPPTAEWSINGVRVDNGGFPPVRGFARFPPATPEVVFGGAALALFGGGGPVSARGDVTLAYDEDGHPYLGRSHFIDFAELPPDSLTNSFNVVARMRGKLRDAGAEYDVGAGGSNPQRILRDCGFAGMGPDGIIWMRPGDIGNAPDEIPAELDENDADNFRYFPNAFFRRTPYINTIGNAFTDPLAITDPGLGSQPFTLREVDFTPNVSTWLFIIDGQPQCVRIAHPAGSDLRRPDEIWNAVIVPAIQNADGPSTVQLGLRAGLVPVTALDVQKFVNRLRYLEYASMLQVTDQGTFTYNDVPQIFPLVPPG